jgi:S-DNA-T family DNA segregation ATPase FtsK/SpoIIIE
VVPVDSGLSIYDPIHFGVDENGRRVEVILMYRNCLLGGEPGSGKSSLLNTIIGHAALSTDCGLWLFDGKQVEFDPWRDAAEVFVGNSMAEALEKLYALQAEMDIRYAMLRLAGRRKITRDDDLPVIMAVIDELAYFSATIGTDNERTEFIRLVRDLVARGRAAGVIVVAATQRPSADIIPTSLRDLFGYRVAFRCTTDSSSDIILSVGWAKLGYTARHIAPHQIGVGWILAEGGTPLRMKAAYLTDADIRAIVAFASDIRGMRKPAAN